VPAAGGRLIQDWQGGRASLEEGVAVSDDRAYEPIATVVQASELLHRAARETAGTVRLPDAEDFDTLGVPWTR